MLEAVDHAGLSDVSRTRTLVCLSRGDRADAAAKQAPLLAPEARRAPCVDLYAIGEFAAVAEARTAGSPVPPAIEPHMITLDNHSTVAVRRDSADGALQGCAVTSPGS